MDTTMASTSGVEQDFHFGNPFNTAFMCILYLCLGTIAILANALNIVIFSLNRELRSNYMFHVVVDFGEIVNGISYITTGIGRGTQLVLGKFDTAITRHDCFYTRYWPTFLILGTQIPAWMTILASTERIVAVHKPALYNKMFSSKMKIVWIICTLGCVLGTLLWAALSAATGDAFVTATSTQHCAIISSTSKAFSTFHFIFVPFAYFGSFCSLCLIWYLHRKTAKGMTTSGKKGPMLSIFIAMTFFDILLCSAPSVVMIGASWQWFKPDDLAVSLTYITTGCLSVCHTVMNFIFHSEFRRQFHKLVVKYLHIRPGTISATSNMHITRIQHSTANRNEPSRAPRIPVK